MAVFPLKPPVEALLEPENPVLPEEVTPELEKPVLPELDTPLFEFPLLFLIPKPEDPC